MSWRTSEAMSQAHSWYEMSPPVRGTVGWGLEVKLSARFAMKAWRTPIPRDHVQMADQRAHFQYLAPLGLSPDRRVYEWVEVSPFSPRSPSMSYLLGAAVVPGVNGCLLGLDGDALSVLQDVEQEAKGAWPLDLGTTAITYVSHNVDSERQALALLGVWLHWVRGAEYALRPW